MQRSKKARSHAPIKNAWSTRTSKKATSMTAVIQAMRMKSKMKSATVGSGSVLKLGCRLRLRASSAARMAGSTGGRFRMGSLQMSQMVLPLCCTGGRGGERGDGVALVLRGGGAEMVLPLRCTRGEVGKWGGAQLVLPLRCTWRGGGIGDTPLQYCDCIYITVTLTDT